MSSQSTLVRREPYEDLEPSYGIMDMIGPELGRGQLTESRINAHMQLEERKHGSGYRRADVEGYEDGEEMFPPVKPTRRRRREHRVGQLVVTPEQEGEYVDLKSIRVHLVPGSKMYTIIFTNISFDWLILQLFEAIVRRGVSTETE